MPNRILRDWTGNDRMNAVSIYAERFFTRLMMKADDFGCFYADTRLLKANLFPLLLDSIREADLSRWVAECQAAGLIVLYESKSKKYLQIQDFRQRLDRMCSKFPKPNDNQVLAGDTTARREVETNPETETKRKPPPKFFIGNEGIEDLMEFFCKKFPRTKEEFSMNFKPFDDRFKNFESQNVGKKWENEQDMRDHLKNWLLTQKDIPIVKKQNLKEL